MLSNISVSWVQSRATTRVADRLRIGASLGLPVASSTYRLARPSSPYTILKKMHKTRAWTRLSGSNGAEISYDWRPPWLHCMTISSSLLQYAFRTPQCWWTTVLVVESHRGFETHRLTLSGQVRLRSRFAMVLPVTCVINWRHDNLNKNMRNADYNWVVIN